MEKETLEGFWEGNLMPACNDLGIRREKEDGAFHKQRVGKALGAGGNLARAEMAKYQDGMGPEWPYRPRGKYPVCIQRAPGNNRTSGEHGGDMDRPDLGGFLASSGKHTGGG